jgi:hypothetical protein
MRVAAVLLAIVSSAFAYQVLSPGGSQGWTNQGAQTLTWQRVETDRQNFTVLLTNQKVSGFQTQNLAALVDGTLGRVALNPPAGGWPTGSSFRLNLVQDNQNLNSILAQSQEFSITQSTSTGASTRTTATTTPGGVTVTPTTTDTNSPTDTLTVPSSAAFNSASVNTGVLALLSLMGIALA